MNIDIEEARYEGGWLMIKAKPKEAIRFLHRFKPGSHELKKTRKKRSLDANGMAWALIHDIAGVMGEAPEQVYRDAVRNVGGVSEVICIQKKAVEMWKKLFIGDHIGRQITEQPSKIPGCVTLICTYGSSDYDVQQMSQLIDSLIQDARALGIETPEDERINSLLKEWDDEKKNKGSHDP